ncbi:S8 family serine peptidase [Flavobacterium sp.]|uniref:S8 family peptidase n=1 Tax=Flavobacterium sp. TaxID=239 RepID=UPI00286DCF8A|nr:S8 family serine peptidase [Flavobacterium sp.]
MTKKVLKISILSLLIFSSCNNDEPITESSVIQILQKEPLSKEQINSEIKESLDSNTSFNWSSESSLMIWSAINQGQSIATIGFGNSKNDFDRSKLTDNKKIENELLQLILKYEKKPLDKVLISSDPFLNLIDVVIEKQETVIAIRNSKFTRYIEPADYRYFQEEELQNERSAVTSSGCGFDAETLATEDYVNVLPNNAKVPWAFYQHNIPTAWNSSTGSGITIGIIDSGTSSEQTLLGSNFNDGYSAGRTIQKYGTYVDSIWPWSSTTDGANDKCGHGTSMASVAAAPRNDNGLPVGVAYNANLVTYRAAANVLLEGYHEHNGVKNAFTALGNNSNVKIISMSMGYIFSVGKIEDGIKYAYNRGKLIFCAGGTSTTFTTFVGVIFPAWMPETVAVTGVKEGTNFQKCDVCHTGGKIDFTIVMQRAASGNTMPINSYYNNQSDYVGGSSVATATTAGIAALVWSKYPTWTRDQVLTKMKQSSSFYPNKSSDFGYGNVNAALAVQ